MDILNKSIKSFTFNDIENFCKLGIREDIQIDYKRDIPKDGLAKFFASFSNTRGGVLIIGVTEDRTTGVPTAWDGVDNNAKTIEQINQWAADVVPLPSYDIGVTNEKNGKIFILIRIFEGDQTPYYIQNDSNIWARTGNISKQIDLASPDWVELLINKKEKAKQARQNYLKMANTIFQSAVDRAEIERLGIIANRKQQLINQVQNPQSNFPTKIYQNKLGDKSMMMTLILQPFYPSKTIADPRTIKDSLLEIRDRGTFKNLNIPELNAEPIPEGVMSFSWDQEDGRITCGQIYSTGLFYFSMDMCRINSENNEIFIHLNNFVGRFFAALKSASNFYNLFGFQGSLVGILKLSGIKGIPTYPIEAQTMIPRYLRYGLHKALQNYYSWSINTDTTTLFDDKNFQKYFIDKAKEIDWSLSYSDTEDNTVMNFLKENHWLVEEPQSTTSP